MKSVLNREVSGFASYTDAVPHPVNLLAFLRSEKYANRVLEIREIEDKEQRDALKAKLPAITPSGIFSPSRGASNLIKHSGLIQFDVDATENPGISFNDLKEQLCNIQEVAYCGLSVSGRGLWGLVPIQWAKWHREHFKALKRQFGPSI